MFLPKLLNLFLLLFSAGWSHTVQATTQGHHDIASNLTINTTSGIYTGFVDASSAPHVNQWLGIRYGQPPVGIKRFRSPEPATAPFPEQENLDLHSYAYEYKPVCFQQSGDHTGTFWELVPEFQNQDPQSEDCLFLNIWAPRRQGEDAGNVTSKEGKGKEKVPVIVWVCGGGFQEGGGHAPYQVPDHWIERMQSHVVVTFNYRLNVFGFPGAAAAKDNVGLLDTRLVVKWVKDNIAAFGGDSERIVLWGQSAGAGVVDSYLYANSDDPIISGAIANSGSPIVANDYRGGGDTSSFSKLASSVGCENLESEEELACMQQVPALRLQTILQSQFLPGTNITVPRFSGGVDNVTVFANNTERLEKGLVAEVPLITGHTANEFAAFLPFNRSSTTAPPLPPSSPGIECSVISEVEKRLHYNLPTYYYIFSGNFSNITPRYWLGAMHSSDLPVIFGTHYLFRGNSTELEWRTAFAMEDLWVSFAANASQDPTERNGLVWPKYGSSLNGSSSVALFGDDDGEGKGVRLVPSTFFNSGCVLQS